MTTNRPQYLRVAEQLRNEILSGALGPGDRLPSGADIARQFVVSREVARHALATLKSEGLTDSHFGRGTFVRATPVLRRRSTTWYDRSVTAPPAHPDGDHRIEHGSRRETATPAIADRLNIEPDAPVMRTEYTARAGDDERPLQFAVSWEDLAITGGTAVEVPDGVDGAAGVVARFDEIGVQIDAVDEVVSARMPTPKEQERLQVPPAVPVLVIRRTYLAGERPVETADIVIPSDRCELHYGVPIR